jgi:hypothetical protein
VKNLARIEFEDAQPAQAGARDALPRSWLGQGIIASRLTGPRSGTLEASQQPWGAFEEIEIAPRSLGGTSRQFPRVRRDALNPRPLTRVEAWKTIFR